MFIQSRIAIRTDIIMVLISLPVFQLLEVCTCIESKGKSSEPLEDTDPEFADISFEELLAQEKKDSFWLISHLFNSWFVNFVFTTYDLTFLLRMFHAGRKMGNRNYAQTDDFICLANLTLNHTTFCSMYFQIPNTNICPQVCVAKSLP